MSRPTPYLIVALALAPILVTGIAFLVVREGPALQLPGTVAGVRRAIAAQRATAHFLRIPWSAWLAIRVAIPVVVLAIVVVGQLSPTLITLCVAIATFVPPWLLEGRARKLRLRREVAIEQMIRTIQDRVDGDMALDVALQDLGRQPPSGLEEMCEPLGRGGRIVDNLREFAVRAQSPIATEFSVIVIFVRTRSIELFRQLLREIMLPYFRDQIRLQRANHRTIAYQRGVIGIMGLVLMTLFFALYLLGPEFRAFYQTGTGALTLGLATAIFVVLVYAVHLILRPRIYSEWDLDLVINEVEKLDG